MARARLHHVRQSNFLGVVAVVGAGAIRSTESNSANQEVIECEAFLLCSPNDIGTLNRFFRCHGEQLAGNCAGYE